MELTPKVFRDVQFREKLRGGYHPEDVDEFLEQAAVAIEGVQAQLRQALDRAQRAEQAATEATTTDEALRRMLILAQRTADQAVAEARYDAERLQSEARAEADRLRIEARQESERLLNESRLKSASMLTDAEEQSRRAYEQGLTDSRDNMARAEEALRQAQQEVEALRSWVELHRSHLLSVLRDAQSLVEGAGLLSEPPAISLQSPEAGSEPSEAEGPTQEDGEGAALQATSLSEETTGEWDPRYLHGTGTNNDSVGSQGVTENGRDGTGTYGSGPDTAGGPNMAFDERALDNFFSDPDMGEARGGFGRFRRRQ